MSELSLNPTRFLNRSAVRDFLLQHAKDTRHHPFTRVSEQTLVEANEVVRRWAISHVAKQPSAGKTL